MKKRSMYNKIFTLKTAKLCCFIFLVLVCYILIHMFIALKSGEIPNDSIRSQHKTWYVGPQGIAMDSQNNLYIGAGDYIMCCNEAGDFLHSYYIRTLGSYCFTIDENDNIVAAISRADCIKIYDQNGQLINKLDDSDGKMYSEIEKDSWYIESADGFSYKLTNWFGYTKVVRVNDGKVMYRIPFNLYLVKIFIPLAFVSFWFMVGYPLRKWQGEIFLLETPT